MPREHEVGALLWNALRVVHPAYAPGKYDGWVLCPRAYALAHLRCIVEVNFFAPHWSADDLSREEWLAYVEDSYLPGRTHKGPDLVFAIGDLQ